MKTIIAGSRDIDSYKEIEAAIEASGFEITTVISGTARGVDRIGEVWAFKHNVPVIKVPANWDFYGKSAGYVRNEKMAQMGEALIAVWDGESKGTKSMIDLARNYGLKTHVHIVKEQGELFTLSTNTPPNPSGVPPKNPMAQTLHPL